jgi:hypothetical protein
LIGSAPTLLNTLVEISTAINNDPNVYNTLNSAIALKANQSTTYTKSEVDSALALKNNVINSSNRLDVSNIGTGLISNTVFNYLQNASSNIQQQITNLSTSKQNNITTTSRLDMASVGNGDVSNATLSFIKNLSFDCQAQLNNSVNTLVNSTVSSLISLSKSSNVLTLNYDSLLTQLSGYLTSSSFSSSISNYYNKNEVDGFINSKANTVNTYSKIDVDFLLNAKADKFNLSSNFTVNRGRCEGY